MVELKAMFFIAYFVPYSNAKRVRLSSVPEDRLGRRRTRGRTLRRPLCWQRKTIDITKTRQGRAISSNLTKRNAFSVAKLALCLKLLKTAKMQILKIKIHTSACRTMTCHNLRTSCSYNIMVWFW